MDIPQQYNLRKGLECDHGRIVMVKFRDMGKERKIYCMVQKSLPFHYPL